MNEYITVSWLADCLNISMVKALTMVTLLYDRRIVDVKLLVFAQEGDKEPLFVRDFMRGPMRDGGIYYYDFAVTQLAVAV